VSTWIHLQNWSKSSSMHNHYDYTHTFLKITPDDGKAETLAQIFTFQITLWIVVKNSIWSPILTSSRQFTPSYCPRSPTKSDLQDSKLNLFQRRQNRFTVSGVLSSECFLFLFFYKYPWKGAQGAPSSGEYNDELYGNILWCSEPPSSCHLLWQNVNTNTYLLHGAESFLRS